MRPSLPSVGAPSLDTGSAHPPTSLASHHPIMAQERKKKKNDMDSKAVPPQENGEPHVERTQGTTKKYPAHERRREIQHHPNGLLRRGKSTTREGRKSALPTVGPTPTTTTTMTRRTTEEKRQEMAQLFSHEDSGVHVSTVPTAGIAAVSASHPPTHIKRPFSSFTAPATTAMLVLHRFPIPRLQKGGRLSTAGEEEVVVEKKKKDVEVSSTKGKKGEVILAVPAGRPSGTTSAADSGNGSAVAPLEERVDRLLQRAAAWQRKEKEDLEKRVPAVEAEAVDEGSAQGLPLGEEEKEETTPEVEAMMEAEDEGAPAEEGERASLEGAHQPSATTPLAAPFIPQEEREEEVLAPSSSPLDAKQHHEEEVEEQHKEEEDGEEEAACHPGLPSPLPLALEMEKEALQMNEVADRKEEEGKESKEREDITKEEVQKKKVKKVGKEVPQRSQSCPVTREGKARMSERCQPAKRLQGNVGLPTHGNQRTTKCHRLPTRLQGGRDGKHLSPSLCSSRSRSRSSPSKTSLRSHPTEEYVSGHPLLHPNSPSLSRGVARRPLIALTDAELAKELSECCGMHGHLIPSNGNPSLSRTRNSRGGVGGGVGSGSRRGPAHRLMPAPHMPGTITVARSVGRQSQEEERSRDTSCLSEGKGRRERQREEKEAITEKKKSGGELERMYHPHNSNSNGKGKWSRTTFEEEEVGKASSARIPSNRLSFPSFTFLMGSSAAGGASFSRSSTHARPSLVVEEENEARRALMERRDMNGKKSGAGRHFVAPSLHHPSTSSMPRQRTSTDATRASLARSWQGGKLTTTTIASTRSSTAMAAAAASAVAGNSPSFVRIAPRSSLVMSGQTFSNRRHSAAASLPNTSIVFDRKHEMEDVAMEVEEHPTKEAKENELEHTNCIAGAPLVSPRPCAPVVTTSYRLLASTSPSMEKGRRRRRRDGDGEIGALTRPLRGPTAPDRRHSGGPTGSSTLSSPPPLLWGDQASTGVLVTSSV